MELTFFDLTLAENSRLRNKQASTPAAVRKTVATAMGTNAKIMLFCAGCWVVTVGGPAAVSVTFLVSFGRPVVVAAAVDWSAAAAAAVVGDVDASAAAVVGDVDASAAVGDADWSTAVGGADALVVAAAAFCVTAGVGRAVGTLLAAEGLADDVLVNGGLLLDGTKTTAGTPSPPPAPLAGMDGGSGRGGRKIGGKNLDGIPPPPPTPPPPPPPGFLPPPGPSTFAHTCVLDVKCPSLMVTYR